MRTTDELAPMIINGSVILPYLTDDEVKLLYKFFTELEQSLGKCGPVMHLAWMAAFKASNEMKGYINARREN